MPIATLVVWTTWVGVGVAGLMLQYPCPAPPAKPPAAVVARIVNIQVTPTAQRPPETNQPLQQTPQVTEPAPPAPQTPAIPAAPPMAEVAIPTPAVAFAVPTSRPTQLSTVRPVVTSSAISQAPQVEHITFGVGEGNQPPPDYPLEAQLDHEEGTVAVRFQVAEDGHVSSAEIASPCNWPLLNQSALRAVRDTWQFAAGKPRLLEVEFQYKAPDQ